MDRLPEELMVLIAECCDHASLKQARLLNRKWHAASTSLVFEEVLMGLFSHSLAKLESIANSHVAKHVKKITFFSDIVPDWSKAVYLRAIDFRPPFRDWLASLSISERERVSKGALGHASHLRPFEQYNDLPRYAFSAGQLDQGYSAFQAAVKDQRHWMTHRSGHRFREHLARLPNLTEARAHCTVPFGGRMNTKPVWSTLRQQILVGPDDWMYSTDFHDSSYQLLSGQAALALLQGIAFRSSFSGNAPLTTLSIHSAHIDPYHRLMDSESDPGHASSISPVQRYSLLPDAFAPVTNLTLHVPHATVSSRLGGPDVARETITFLRAARRLTRLNLRYGDDELSPDDDATHLEPLFADVHWPALRHLQLATNVSAATLVPFLARHAATLRGLALRDMLVRDVDRALAQLPRVLRLQRVYVECLWDDDAAAAARSGESAVARLCTLSRGTDFDAPYERAVRAYLLRESDRMPDIERDGGLGDVDDWQDDPDVPMLDGSDLNDDDDDDDDDNPETGAADP